MSLSVWSYVRGGGGELSGPWRRGRSGPREGWRYYLTHKMTDIKCILVTNRIA